MRAQPILCYHLIFFQWGKKSFGSGRWFIGSETSEIITRKTDQPDVLKNPDPAQYLLIEIYNVFFNLNISYFKGFFQLLSSKKVGSDLKI